MRCRPDRPGTGGKVSDRTGSREARAKPRAAGSDLDVTVRPGPARNERRCSGRQSTALDAPAMTVVPRARRGIRGGPIHGDERRGCVRGSVDLAHDVVIAPAAPVQPPSHAHGRDRRDCRGCRMPSWATEARSDGRGFCGRSRLGPSRSKLRLNCGSAPVCRLFRCPAHGRVCICRAPSVRPPLQPSP